MTRARIRALIVDDEPLARRHVRTLLFNEPDFEVAGEAGFGAEAVILIETLRPDLVFLDIQMPEMTGFDVIAAVGLEAMPATVFITAFDAHAIQAFEVQALDYLLKPFDDERFARVLSRVRGHRAAPSERLRRALEVQTGPVKLVTRSRGVARVIALDDIDWIGAAGDYAEVHTAGKSFLIDESLTSLAARLPPAQFVRIHRGAIIRLDRLSELHPAAHGDGIVRLNCGTELRLSRRYRQAIDMWLSA